MKIYLRYKLLLIKKWFENKKPTRTEYHIFVKKNKKELKALRNIILETASATHSKMIAVPLYSFLKNCNINPDVDDFGSMLNKYFKPISFGITVHHPYGLLNLKSYYLWMYLK